MKRRDIKALAEAKSAELQQQLHKLYAELATARHQKKVGKLSNPRSVAMMSDDIARIQTVLRERQLLEAVQKTATAE